MKMELGEEPIGTLPEGWWGSQDGGMPDWTTILDLPWWGQQVADHWLWLLLAGAVALAIIVRTIELRHHARSTQ